MHRLGQRNVVDVHYLVAPGSVDERMYAAVERRGREASMATEGERKGLQAQEVTREVALRGGKLCHAFLPTLTDFVNL